MDRASEMVDVNSKVAYQCLCSQIYRLCVVPCVGIADAPGVGIADAPVYY